MEVAGVAAAEGATITYRLNDTVNFGIDNTGIIYTIRRLDHEGSDGQYILQVTAKEQGKYTWVKDKMIMCRPRERRNEERGR